LEEIETQLAQMEGIRDVAVAAREDVPGESRLVAYYTGVKLPTERVREHAKSSLPGYMVPTVYVYLDALPLTPNGKLDRAALPTPPEEAYSSRAYEEPQGAIEQTLAQLWSQLLKVDRVGRHDNFFELGGHSLLAITLIERMRRENLRVDITLLFTAPTLAELAELLGTASQEVEVPPNLIQDDWREATLETDIEELRL